RLVDRYRPRMDERNLPIGAYDLVLDALIGLAPSLPHFFPGHWRHQMLLRAAVELHKNTLLFQPRDGAERAIDEAAWPIGAHRHDARTGRKLEMFRHRQIDGPHHEVTLDHGAKGRSRTAKRRKALLIVALGGGARRRQQQRLDAVAMSPDATCIESLQRIRDALARADAAENIDE